MPQLQIISEDCWKAAHDRLKATRATYLQGIKGELWGRPANTLDSKYLLTGLAKCGSCGDSLYAKSSSRKIGRALFYGCMTNHLRGQTACKNNLLTPMERTDEEVLAVLERDVLHPDVTKAVVRKALDKFRASEKERAALHKQITAVDSELKRLVSAIPALVEAVKAATERRETISLDLAHVDQQQHSDDCDIKR